MLFMVIEKFRNQDGKAVYAKLRDSGRVRIEAEGLPLAIRFEDADAKALELPLDKLARAHVEAAFLSFIREVLGGAQHAFSDD